MTPRTATASLIASASQPKARRRRSEARVKLETTAVGYLRVSTEEQAASGLGLEAQRAELVQFADKHGLTVTSWHVDAGVSAATMNRPALLAALGALDAGRAGVLLAKDASRLSRSLSDLSALLKAATSDGWCVRTADGLVDTCDPQGQLLPHFLGIVADLERQFTSQRTRQALAAAKARGTRLGKQSSLPAAIVVRIIDERDAGATWQSVADGLNAERVPTGQGGAMWRPSSVRAAYMAGRPELATGDGSKAER